MQFHQANKMPLFSILCIFAFAAEIFASCSVGAKLGVAASAFNYSDRVMDPYIAFDIDLRPYLGYDIKWVQLGEQKPLLAPIVSCFLNYKFTNRFFFRPEVAITQKGVVFNQYDYERIIYEVKMTYLQIPLTLGYQVVVTDRFIAEFYAGGAGALKLDAFKLRGEKNELQSSQVQYPDDGGQRSVRTVFKFSEWTSGGYHPKCHDEGVLGSRGKFSFDC